MRCHSDPHIVKKDQFQEQSLSEESLFCHHISEVDSKLPDFTCKMQDLMVCVRMNISKRESDLYSSVSSPTLMRDRMVTDHIRKRLRIQNEQSPGGPHKSEVKERILLHSQLLLVSYLVHRYYLCPISFTDTTCVLSHSQLLLVSCLAHSYYLCPISQARTEGQSKITNTKSVFKVSQIDSAKGSAFIQN